MEEDMNVTDQSQTSTVPEIFEYVKNGKNQKVGILVAQRYGKTVSIGWSKTNFKSGDGFKKEDGLKIARERLLKRNLVKPVVIPQIIERNIHQFMVRCARYFKDTYTIGVSVALYDKC
jgi:hypothetical protein